MKCNKIICLMLAAVLVFSFASCKKDETKKENTQAKTEETKKDEIKEEDIYEGLIEKAPDENETAQTEEAPKNETETLNEGNGPVNIESGDDIVSKIDEFNSLSDGDPRKEEIRKELEELFENANGTTFEN